MVKPEGKTPVFSRELVDILRAIPVYCGQSGRIDLNDHHQRALDLFEQGEYFEAHEEWESIWRTHPLGSADRHGVQSLIRLCAAGVKAQGNNHPAFDHHCNGALNHLLTAQSLARESNGKFLESWPFWAPLLAWRQMGSQPDQNVQK